MGQFEHLKEVLPAPAAPHRSLSPLTCNTLQEATGKLSTGKVNLVTTTTLLISYFTSFSGGDASFWFINRCNSRHVFRSRNSMAGALPAFLHLLRSVKLLH